VAEPGHPAPLAALQRQHEDLPDVLLAVGEEGDRAAVRRDARPRGTGAARRQEPRGTAVPRHALEPHDVLAVLDRAARDDRERAVRCEVDVTDERLPPDDIGPQHA